MNLIKKPHQITSTTRHNLAGHSNYHLMNRYPLALTDTFCLAMIVALNFVTTWS